MGRAFNPASWTDGVTIPHAADFQHIALDLYSRGDNVDGGGYGRANTGFVGLIPGALPGTMYTVTGASWSGGVATITVGGHTIGVNQLVTLASVTPSGWNVGPVKVTAVTSTTFSFALAANPGTYTSGGTVLVGSVPGLGTLAADPNNHLQMYTGSSWVAATTAVAAGTWLAGSGAPSSITGSNGDMYVNTANGDLYGPKAGGAWGASSLNVKGPTGSAGAGYGGTSTTSITLGTGAKTFTMLQTGLAYTVGARVRASSAATPGRYMEGIVTAYSGTSLTLNVDTTGTAGTAADWSFNIAGNVGASGAGSGDMVAATYDPAGVAGQLLKDSGADGILNRNGSGITSQAKADQLSAAVYATAAGTANAITATLSPAITAYVDGARYRIKAANANTGAATINICGLGVKTLKKWSAGALVDLVAGDISAGQMLDLTYDSTTGFMQLPATGVASSVAGSVRCRAFASSAQSIPSGAWTSVALDSETYDVGGLHDTVTNNSRATVPTGQAGGYFLSASITFQANGTGQRYVSLWKNGATPQIAQQQVPALPAGAYIELTVSAMLPLADGDYVEVRLFQDSGVSQSTFAGDGQTCLTLVRIW